MVDPLALTTAIDNASKVANTPLFTTVIDRLAGFKISQWAAEGEVRKKLIHDEYQKAKENGIIGIQYIESLRHTTNLIDTAAKSAKYIDPYKPHEIAMDNDFFWNTIEHAKKISNEEMQELIAKIIAGEYNKPGTYSMSTLHVLKMIGKQELEIFEKLCSLCIFDSQIPQDVFFRPDSLEPILNSLGVDFGTLQLLQNLELFLPSGMTRTIDNPQKKNVPIKYFDKIILYEPIDETNCSIVIPGYYELSNTGKQIIGHLNPKFNQGYFEWLKSEYKINNFKSIES
jgi:hypothetical protein